MNTYTRQFARSFRTVSKLGLVALCLLGLATVSWADPPFTPLHYFGAPDVNGYNPDGAYPKGRLLQAKNGFFYGTTVAGGYGGAGTVFAVSSQGDFGLYGNLEFEVFLRSAALTLSVLTQRRFYCLMASTF